MRLSVQVKARSKKPGIERLSQNEWIVRVSEPALEGRANQAVLSAVAAELGVSKSRVSLIRGDRSRQKLLEVVD